MPTAADTDPLSVILNTTTEMSPEMPKASGNAAAMTSREPIMKNWGSSSPWKASRCKAAGVINSSTDKETAARLDT